MVSAPVQNSSSLATLRFGFGSLFIFFFFCFQFYSIVSFSQINTSSGYKPGTPDSKLISQSQSYSFSNKSSLKSRQLKNRRILVGGINAVSYGGSLIILSSAWYRDYDKTPFHVFEDSKEWLQIDKFGHAWSAYNTGKASTALWKWAGLSNKNATLVGGLSGTLYMTVIEFLDAHSSEWGWSWADMGANIFGSGLFISQQLGWEEQRIQYKFSFHRKNYSDAILNQRSDELYGNSWHERVLKDYNGQTYWFSFNLKSFFPDNKLPAWLNIAAGYGADGMFGGFENIAKDENDNVIFDRTDIPRRRQFYLSPDIDLSKIRTDSKFVRTLLSALNALKFPAPALEFSKGKFKAHLVYF